MPPDWTSNLHLQLPGETGQINIDLSSIGRLNSNCSEEEELYIRKVLCAAESLLQSWSVDGDLQEKEEVVDLVGRCKVALAPQKKLPPDVLRSIFQICNQNPTMFPLSRPDRDLRLLRITHVCAAWRQLALETPVLWNNIGISSLTSSWYLKTLSIVRQWFDRAQNTRKSLSVVLDHRTPYIWEQLLDFIAQYRLEELALMYPINHLPLKLPNPSWRSIERLHLSNCDIYSTSGQPLFSDFGKLSNLRHLMICRCYDIRGMDRVVPWHQLRTLDIVFCRQSGITPSLFIKVLRKCESLEYLDLTLENESSFISTSAMEARVVLDNVDYFRMSFSDGSSASAFLELLVMPNVTKFTVETPSYCDTKLDFGMSSLVGMIQHSGGMQRIRGLTVNASSPLLDIGILLELLPSLETISIPGFLTDSVIEQLSSGKLGPRLLKICLDCHLLQDAEKILSMVESRYQSATEPSSNEGSVKSRHSIFRYISVRCTPDVGNRTVYDDRVGVMRQKYNVDIFLHLAS